MDPPLSPEISVRPSCQRIDYPTGHDRFRQIFRDHSDRWCDLRMEAEVPADQRAYANKTVLCLMLCRDPEGGYARYVCPGCQKELRVHFSCKTRFCPSCGKIKVDNWIDDITKDILEVSHLHITLTTDDSLRPFFRRDSRLVNELLCVAAQAVQEVVSDLYPAIRIGMIYTVHPAGRDQIYKPHVHLVMTKGGLIDGKWVEIEGVPGARLSAKWRYLLCKRLRELRPTDTVLQLVIAKTYQENRGFVVYTESFYPKGIEAKYKFLELKKIICLGEKAELTVDYAWDEDSGLAALAPLFPLSPKGGKKSTPPPPGKLTLRGALAGQIASMGVGYGPGRTLYNL